MTGQLLGNLCQAIYLRQCLIEIESYQSKMQFSFENETEFTENDKYLLNRGVKGAISLHARSLRKHLTLYEKSMNTRQFEIVQNICHLVQDKY